jgi:hypothetical protein
MFIRFNVFFCTCFKFLVYFEDPVHIKNPRTLCNGCFFRLDDFNREEEETLAQSLPFLAYLLPFLLLGFILLIFLPVFEIFLPNQKSNCNLRTTDSQETLIIVNKNKCHLRQVDPDDPPIPV